LEWYDFGLYGLFAPIFAQLFFPDQDRIASLIGAYSGFAIGFAARLWCGRRRVTMLFVVTPKWPSTAAPRGRAGESLVEGETGSVATDSDLRAYVGIAPELFAANAGFGTFMTAFYKDQRFDGDAFLHQQNPFARRNVTAIVLEVPSELIGKGKINAWATISLFGHAPEVQVSRWACLWLRISS
jgi:hypothetical protein